MGKKKLKTLSDLDIHLYNDHVLPSTRREFLASGLLAFSAMAIAPSILLHSPDAYAQQCLTPANCGIPFLSFEGAGGMNIAGGNAMVGFDPDQEQESFGQGMQLSDYIRLGLPSDMHPSKTGMLNRDYGLVFHSTSGLLEGLNEVLTPMTADETDLRKSIDGIIICARSSDDSGDNPINAAFQAQRAGSQGQLVQLIGGSNTDTGARSPAVATQTRTEIRSSRITRFNDASGLLSIGSDAMNSNFLNADGTGGTERIKAFLNRIKNLSQRKMDNFVNKELEKQKYLTAQGKTQALFDKFSPRLLNPTNTPESLTRLQGAFGGTNMAVEDENIASIAHLVMERIAGVGSITVGGCDYHNGSASSGQAKDRQIGRYIGKCIKLAASKGQNLFIHLYSDGGVTGDNGGQTDDTPEGGGRVIWTSDSGTRSSQLCIVYKHNHDRDNNGSLILKDKTGKEKTRQIGFFNKAGGVNTASSSVASSTDQIWKAVILNYLSSMSTASGDDAVVADVLAKWRELFPSETLPQDAEELIRIKPLAA